MKIWTGWMASWRPTKSGRQGEGCLGDEQRVELLLGRGSWMGWSAGQKGKGRTNVVAWPLQCVLASGVKALGKNGCWKPLLSTWGPVQWNTAAITKTLCLAAGNLSRCTALASYNNIRQLVCQGALLWCWILSIMLVITFTIKCCHITNLYIYIYMH